MALADVGKVGIKVLLLLLGPSIAGKLSSLRAGASVILKMAYAAVE